ncbi:hypothetical protein GF327_07745 [Candidatus Woesearchaeota archaeon]|nr:hypothetical protein [Candidatus Woesearchaeota archaeon]
MLNSKEFEKIKNQMDKEENNRDNVINKSRELIKISKQLIYSAHRKEKKKGRKIYEDMKRKKKALQKLVENQEKLKFIGIYSVALQEYVEAACYFEFVTNKNIPCLKSLDVSYYEYLLGLCDLTGEMERNAVYSTVREEFDEVKEIRQVVDSIYKEFLKFDLRDNKLRKKSDAIKWNLKRIDEVLYDLKLKNKI